MSCLNHEHQAHHSLTACSSVQSFINVAGIDYIPAIFAVFHLNSKVSSVNQVISCLFVHSLVPLGQTDSTTDLFIELFLIRLKCYLSFPGHPRHSLLQTPGHPEYVSDQVIEDECNNSLLRIKLFMVATTDHVFVPLSDHWCMTVSLLIHMCRLGC